MKKSPVTKIQKVCEYCDHVFTSEKRYANHRCTMIKRLEQQFTDSGKLALIVYNHYMLTYHPDMCTDSIGYTKFAKSNHYKMFFEFATYCIDSVVVDPIKYCDWLLSNRVKIKDWTSDHRYTIFLKLFLREEDPYSAIDRSIRSLINECTLRGCDLDKAFEVIHPNKICSLLVSGVISPWVIYQSDSGKRLLDRLNEDQVNLIYEYIDPPKWAVKFNRQATIVMDVKQVFSHVGM